MTFEISKFSTELSHFYRISVHIDIICFAFKGGNKQLIDFSEIELFEAINSNTYISLLRTLYKRAVQHLINYCYFEVGNITTLLTNGIPLGIGIYIYQNMNVVLWVSYLKNVLHKLYDKRDDFCFSIVLMPNLRSNIPSTVFYWVVISEFVYEETSVLTNLEMEGGFSAENF